MSIDGTTRAETRQDFSPAPVSIDDLVAAVTRTLPDGGMDRMTSARVEELLSVAALTAHI